MAALTDAGAYDTDPERAWAAAEAPKFTPKYLAAFKAVAGWRERTAQQRDQPRGRILEGRGDRRTGQQPAGRPGGLQPAAVGAQGLSAARDSAPT